MERWPLKKGTSQEAFDQRAHAVFANIAAAIGLQESLVFMREQCTDYQIKYETEEEVIAYVNNLIRRFPILNEAQRAVERLVEPISGENVRTIELKVDAESIHKQTKTLFNELWEDMHNHRDASIRMTARSVVAQLVAAYPYIISTDEDALYGIDRDAADIPLTFHQVRWPCALSEEFLMRQRNTQSSIASPIPHLEFKDRGHRIALCTKTFRSKNGDIFIRGVWYAFLNTSVFRRKRVALEDSNFTGDFFTPLRSATPNGFLLGNPDLPDFADL